LAVGAGGVDVSIPTGFQMFGQLASEETRSPTATKKVNFSQSKNPKFEIEKTNCQCE
jgi:hypothetical protein